MHAYLPVYFPFIPLETLVNAILCPFCKLKTVKTIWMKLHTVVEHHKTMCGVHKTINLLCISLDLLPFDHFIMSFYDIIKYRTDKEWVCA